MTTLMGKEIASLSVVIPNFNGAHLLRQNLPSVVAALEKSGLRHEIIVADDCSTDDSVSFLGSEYPQIRIVKNETNRGFAKNINSGLKKATGSLVLCLNSDV
ncbi:glycosyltransferase family 2 protein, partial [bacterium]|nr:glycosyltransferase family 2 protein [bacterium]